MNGAPVDNFRRAAPLAATVELLQARELADLRDRVAAERATARRAEAARAGHQRAHLALIARCAGCGGWAYNDRCTTPHPPRENL